VIARLKALDDTDPTHGHGGNVPRRRRFEVGTDGTEQDLAFTSVQDAAHQSEADSEAKSEDGVAEVV
jgi:hypothetical protein